MQIIWLNEKTYQCNHHSAVIWATPGGAAIRNALPPSSTSYLYNEFRKAVVAIEFGEEGKEGKLSSLPKKPNVEAIS